MFDIEKMKEILEGDFYRMPSGMTREERRDFMKDVAEGRVEPIARRGTCGLTKEKSHKISLNTEQAYLDKYASLSDKVTLTKEQLKKSGEESLKAYGEVDNLSNDKVFDLEEFTQL